MKKRFYLIAALAFIGLIAVAATQSSTFYSVYIKYHRTSPWLIKLLDSGGSEAMYTSNAGNTELKNLTVTGGSTLYGIGMLHQDAVVIGTSTQLSTWSGQAGTAGQSYYQTSPGIRYIVDPYAIEQSFTRGTNGTFSGVSMILPSAATYPEYTVTIEVAVSGASGWAALDGATTGTTMVTVWPYAGGSTSYNRDTSIAQTMVNWSHYLTSGTTVAITPRNMAAGASFWMLDKPGESATFALYNSQVSAYPVNWNLLN